MRAGGFDAEDGMKQTPMQVLLGMHLRELGIITMPEYVLREAAAGSAAPEHIGFEISGSNWTGKYRRGRRKMNIEIESSAAMGIRVFQFTTPQVCSGEAKRDVAAYWNGVSAQMNEYYQKKDLNELLKRKRQYSGQTRREPSLTLPGR
jgi:hypothetical protein